MTDGYVLDVDTSDDYYLLSTLREALEAEASETQNGHCATPDSVLNGKKRCESESGRESDCEKPPAKFLTFDSCFANRHVRAPAALCVSNNRSLHVYDAISKTLRTYDSASNELVHQVSVCDCFAPRECTHRQEPGYRLLPNHVNEDLLAVLPCCSSLLVLDKHARPKVRMRLSGFDDPAHAAAVCIDLRGSAAFALAGVNGSKQCEMETFDLRFGNCVSTTRVSIREPVANARGALAASGDLDLQVAALCVNPVRHYELLALATSKSYQHVGHGYGAGAASGESFLLAVDLRRSDVVRRCIALSDISHSVRNATDCAFNLSPRTSSRNLCDLLVLHADDDCGGSACVSVLDAVTFDLRERMRTDRPTLFAHGANARLALSVSQTETNIAHICAPDTPFITAWQY